jgi:flagellar basal body-associated protein FliL
MARVRLRYNDRYMSKRSQYIALTLAVVAVITAVGAAIYVMFFGPPSYNNIDTASTSSGLSVVLPSSLPAGSSVITHPQFDDKTGIISTVISTKDTEVTFSQQRRPETDLKQIDAADTFLVNAGPVYILKGEEGRLQAIVETSDSWLIVNAGASIGNATFKAILESLETI